MTSAGNIQQQVRVYSQSLMDENNIETSLEVCIDEKLILTRGNLPVLPNETIAVQTLSTNAPGMQFDLSLSSNLDQMPPEVSLFFAESLQIYPDQSGKSL